MNDVGIICIDQTNVRTEKVWYPGKCISPKSSQIFGIFQVKKLITQKLFQFQCLVVKFFFLQMSTQSIKC